MELNTQTPHDAFMKGVLADIAKVRTFLQSLLPAELTDPLDLETLQHEKSSFIRGNLSEYLSDAVFSVQLKKQGKREAILISYQNGIPIDILSLQTGYSTEEVQRIFEQK